MGTRILLITPDPGFGELLDQILTEDGGFAVDLASGGIAALNFAQESRYDLVVLDSAVPDVPFAELAHTLLDWHAGLRLIVIPPGNDPAHPDLAQVTAHAFLSKPFYLPDLLQLVGNLLNGEPVEPTRRAAAPPNRGKPYPSDDPSDDPDEPYPWLSDVSTAAQYLARLTLETAAKAALITRGERLWAYAGELGQPGGDRLAELVGRQWGSQSGNDLARFVTLENDHEYMLYATALVDELVLSLIFDAKTPFSKIRSQSNRLAKALSADPDRPERVPESPRPAAIEDRHPTPANRHSARFEAEGDQTGTAGKFVEVESPGFSPASHPDFALTNAFDESVYHSPIPRRRDLLADPDPDLEALEPEHLLVDWLPSDLHGDPGLLAEVEDALQPFAIPPDWQPSQDLSPGPRSFLEEILGEPLPPAGRHNRPGDAGSDGRPFYPPPETMAETRPTRALPDEPAARLEPESASFSNITYACVLLPRLPKHHLVGEPARLLENWMLELCISFDWRLEQLSIRPEHMQWQVRVHSATAPRFLMQITSKITSQRMFERFIHLRDDNPSGEFWAPGWLVITGEKLPPNAMVQEFIRKTRARQGI
ncbi:MAG TPA: transposase [Anaerolineales bacterium]|nr:transposase [Anaerolineales bacterium]